MIASVVLGFSCGGKKNTGNICFEAETLRGKTVEFSHTEYGMVSISAKNMEKMSAMDQNGMPVYPTNDIADTFVAGPNVVMKNRQGLCVRFNVPEINSNDYLIIKVETRLPKEIVLNGEKTSSIDASYRYDSRYSGKTEYIWFLFDDAYKELMIPGTWKLELFSNDSPVYRAEYSVK